MPAFITSMVLGGRIPWQLVLRFHWPKLLLVASIAAAVVTVDRGLGYAIRMSPTPFQIAGVAIAILLGFRNSAGYDRWWEGRKLWGGIVNASRALARQTATLPVANEGERDALKAAQRQLLERQLAWLAALRHRLRGQDPLPELRERLSPEDFERVATRRNQATGLLELNGEALVELSRRGWLTEERLAAMDRTLTELVSLQGGCERIKGTPLPAAYGYFTAKFVDAYSYALPLGLVEHLGVATVFAVLALAFMFLVLSTIGRLLEDPFTEFANALPLDAICRTIEIDLRQTLGDAPPDPIQPRPFYDVQVLH